MKAYGIVLVVALSVAAALCAQEKIDDGIGELSFSLLKKLMEKDNRNIVISGLSVSEALGMCLLGSRRETFTEMVSILGLSSLSRDQIIAAYHDLNQLPAFKKTATESSDAKIHRAHRLFVRDCVALNPTYQAEVQSNLDASVQKADFEREGGESLRTEINEFFANSTNNLIEELLKDPLSAETVLFVINTLYFRGSWQKKFDQQESDDIFNGDTCNGSGTSKITWMRATNDFDFKESSLLGAFFLNIPYELDYRIGDRISMVILYPGYYNRCDFDGWLSQLKWGDVVSEMDSTNWGEVELMMPSFKAESNFKMSQVLSSLGMPTAFSDDADFSWMTRSESRIKISEIFHGAKIDTNVNGTEAAAATGSDIRFMSAIEYEKKLRIDSTFLSIIVLRRANGSKVPLFVTVVKNADY